VFCFGCWLFICCSIAHFLLLLFVVTVPRAEFISVFSFLLFLFRSVIVSCGIFHQSHQKKPPSDVFSLYVLCGPQKKNIFFKKELKNESQDCFVTAKKALFVKK